MLNAFLALFLLLSPKLSVTPRFHPEPATVTMLVTNIPDGARVICFVLDGDNYYGGCKDVEGRRSYRVEYKGVLGGSYQAFVTIDKQRLPEQTIIITKVGD